MYSRFCNSFFLIFGFVLFTLTSCESVKPVINFNLDSESRTYKLFNTVGVTTQITPKTLTVDSAFVYFQSQKYPITFNTNGESKIKIPLKKEVLLGVHDIDVKVFTGRNRTVSSSEITVLNHEAPKVYSYKIKNTYPHNAGHFTQGLEFLNDEVLLESTGMRGSSKLMHKDLKTGKILKEYYFDNQYFGEGITKIGDKVCMLTWQSGKGFIFNTETLELIRKFNYQDSKEGWGLCLGDKYVYKSDGTSRIWKLDPETLEEVGSIQITTNKSIKSRFNELEWVDGKIYANTWQKNGIAIINPTNGAVEGVINLKGLNEKVGVPATDKRRVLNGIAYNKNTKKLFITGKYWKSLFEIEVVE